jgi:hypothetical protein
MSMICFVRGLTPAQVDALQSMPLLINDLTRLASCERNASFWENVKRKHPEADQAADTALSDATACLAEARERAATLGPTEPALCLEKSWHMLHYLLSGDIDPTGEAGDLLLTGEELGEDQGYGPARLHSPTETQLFSDFLESRETANLQAGIDFREMSRLGVYPMVPGGWGWGSDAEHESALRQDVAFYFPRLRDYVSKMSDKGNALLVWLS